MSLVLFHCHDLPSSHSLKLPLLQMGRLLYLDTAPTPFFWRKIFQRGKCDTVETTAYANRPWTLCQGYAVLFLDSQACVFLPTCGQCDSLDLPPCSDNVQLGEGSSHSRWDDHERADRWDKQDSCHCTSGSHGSGHSFWQIRNSSSMFFAGHAQMTAGYFLPHEMTKSWILQHYGWPCAQVMYSFEKGTEEILVFSQFLFQFVCCYAMSQPWW